MDKFYGKWIINKKKSESMNEFYKFVGVPYLVRKLIGNNNTLVIKPAGKGLSITDIPKEGQEMKDEHTFDERYINSINGRGKSTKSKSMFKNGVATIMTLIDNDIMIIRQLNVHDNLLRDRLYFKRFTDNKFKGVTRFYNKE